MAGSLWMLTCANSDERSDPCGKLHHPAYRTPRLLIPGRLTTVNPVRVGTQSGGAELEGIDRKCDDPSEFSQRNSSANLAGLRW
jgi:hypothetical protein